MNDGPEANAEGGREEATVDSTVASKLASTATGSDSAGGRIGPYVLLSRIGEGGFGTVWLAERREPFVQRVALKVIKPGMDSREVLGRFEQERQSLALMHHPGIARVLDGGLTESGRPYFVMEYVRGMPITEFCDARRLTIRQRVELFRQVCDAVQHAHLKGVIHRDLKPSNILAFDVEGTAIGVKVIDFGVAKATGTASAAHGMFTEIGQLVGTPEYMSPEQADARTAEVDTRSDVYSLGVVLYELLAGVTPLDIRAVRDRGYREMQRFIHETEPPPPSTRLSMLGDAALKARIIQARRQSEAELRRCLRGELEWIPLLAMRKEPQNRYQSAMELARDLDRYLGGQALQAGPPSVRYRLRKAVRRHRGLFAGAAAMLLALTAGLALAGWQWREAVSAAERADQKASEAAAVRDFVIDSLIRADPMQGGRREFTVRDAMVQAIASLDRGTLRAQPEAEATLQRTIALILKGNADLARAAELAERAAGTMERLHGGRSAQLAQCVDTLGNVRMEQGLYPQAEASFREALAIREATLDPDHPEIAASMNNLAEVLRLLGRLEEAVPLFERAIEIQTRTPGPDSEPLAQSVTNLAIARVEQGRLPDAEALFRRALEARRRALGPRHPETASAICNLGALFDVSLQPERARPLYEEALSIRLEALGPNHPAVADTRNNLGSCEQALGRTDAALVHFAEALRIWEANLGPDHPDVATALGNVACVQIELGQIELARAEIERAFEITRRSVGSDHDLMHFLLDTRGRLHEKAGEHAAAEAAYREALATVDRARGRAHPDAGATLHALARVLLQQGRGSEALEAEREAIGIIVAAHGDEFPALSEMWDTMSRIETSLGHAAEAEAAMRKADAVTAKVRRP